jgi:mono/diheme cytochrome c family protein
MKRLPILLLGAVLGLAPALAKPVSYALPSETSAFKPAGGPGYAAAKADCGACHSADYVATQPPGKGKDFWTAEVTKMVKVYGASIPEGDRDAIAAYLAETY